MIWFRFCLFYSCEGYCKQVRGSCKGVTHLTALSLSHLVLFCVCMSMLAYPETPSRHAGVQHLPEFWLLAIGL